MKLPKRKHILEKFNRLVNPGSKGMPCQHGAEMPDDRQLFAAINVVNSSTMNKSEKRPSSFIFKKSTHFRQPTWPNG